MIIRSLFYSALDTITYNGLPHIEVVLGNQGDFSASLLEVVQLIDRTAAEQQMKALVVAVDGRVPDERDPDEILQFVQVLRRKGYIVIGKTSGTVFPRWLPECSFTQVMVTNEPWLGYECSEIQYIPPNEGPLIEPGIGFATKAIRSLNLPVKFDPAEVFGFLSRAKYSWQLVVPPKQFYAINILR
jgi:hypothetical protein